MYEYDNNEKKKKKPPEEIKKIIHIHTHIYTALTEKGRIMDDIAELKTHLADYVSANLTKSKGHNMYCCPACGSGTGKHATGAFTVYDEGTRWKCHACQEGGDLFDLIGIVENIGEQKAQFERARELYGTPDASEPPRPARTKKPAAPKPEKKESLENTFRETAVRGYIGRCEANLEGSEGERYLLGRGFTPEIMRLFRMGYDESWRKKREKVVIIPYPGQNYFIARLLSPPESWDETTGQKKTSGKYQKPKVSEAGAEPLFLYGSTEGTTLFITEGQLDAVSLVQAGATNVCAIGGGGQRKLEGIHPARAVIVLDNDEAGENTGDRIREQIKGVPCITVHPPEGYKDSNDVLQANMEELVALVKAWDDRATEAEKEREKAEEEAREAARKEWEGNAAGHHIDSFLDKINNGELDTPAASTGFSALDTALDGGIYAGLFVIGAISSLGKTTLAMQIADHIAGTGQDVLIFSLEMARSELMAKSISRHTAERTIDTPSGMNQAKTARDITASKRYSNYTREELYLINGAVGDYKKYADNIYIFEGVGDIGAEKVRQSVETHKSLTGRTPVILIDYLQLLAPYDIRATDKQNTDKSVLELKRISRDFKTPVIAISSMNRSNYLTPVDFESFKESGGIEYTADVITGLQLECMNEDIFSKKEGIKEKRDRIKKAKAESPRKVELVILKNRGGQTGQSVHFEYYPAYNLFRERGEWQTAKPGEIPQFKPSGKAKVV